MSRDFTSAARAAGKRVVAGSQGRGAPASSPPACSAQSQPGGLMGTPSTQLPSWEPSPDPSTAASCVSAAPP